MPRHTMIMYIKYKAKDFHPCGCESVLMPDRKESGAEEGRKPNLFGVKVVQHRTGQSYAKRNEPSSPQGKEWLTLSTRRERYRRDTVEKQRINNAARASYDWVNSKPSLLPRKTPSPKPVL
jgi:hypothetical protein